MKQKLKDNEKNCFAFAAQRTEFPDGPIVKFKNIRLISDVSEGISRKYNFL